MVDRWHAVRIETRALGFTVKKRREKMGLSLMDFAATAPSELKLDAPWLSRIERGSVIPTPEQAGWLLQGSVTTQPVVAPTPARTSDPITSKINLPSTNTQVHWGISEILRMYPEGLADFEIEARYLGRHDTHPKQYPHVTDQRLRTARAELVHAGRVRPSQRTKLNDRGRQCRIWVYQPSRGEQNA